MSAFYTPSGRPIDVIEWATKYEDGENTGLPYGRHIGDTKVGPLRVSTVWLGLDHSFQYPYIDDNGELCFPPALIFETMVFAPRVTWYHDLESHRYTTIEQAVAGHWSTVRRMRRRWPLELLRALHIRHNNFQAVL